MNGEIWKDVQDYEGLYQVSNLGRVKSLSNRSNHKNELILKPAVVQGYKKVNLYKKSIGKIFPVHRLVAVAFIENPMNKEMVNHIDGNKLNNCIDNLEWNTAKENTIHAIKNKLIIPKKGNECKRSIQVAQIDILTNKILKTYGSYREAERLTGIPHSNIRKCIMGKFKQTGGYGWIKL